MTMTMTLQNTVMVRWSMVCNRDNYFNTIGQSVLFVGHFAGDLAAGYLADWYGRKVGFLLALIPGIGCLFASAFIDNPWVWVMLRFFIGMSTMAMITIKSVYIVSWPFKHTWPIITLMRSVDKKYRKLMWNIRLFRNYLWPLANFTNYL